MLFLRSLSTFVSPFYSGVRKVSRPVSAEVPEGEGAGRLGGERGELAVRIFPERR